MLAYSSSLTQTKLLYGIVGPIIVLKKKYHPNFWRQVNLQKRSLYFLIYFYKKFSSASIIVRTENAFMISLNAHNIMEVSFN